MTKRRTVDELLNEIGDILRRAPTENGEWDILVPPEVMKNIYEHLSDYKYKTSSEQSQKQRQQQREYEDIFRGTSADWTEHAQTAWEELFRSAYGGSFYQGTNRKYYEQARNQGKTSGGEKSQRKWWEVLGCRPTATKQEITKAYRSLAMKLHPDRPGGDTSKFQELEAAKREALGGLR